MSNSGPSTSKIEFDSTETHGTPVSLDDEPAYPSITGAAPGRPVAVTDQHVERKVVKRPVGEPKNDPDLRQKLLQAGALVAFGFAVVLGVRHFKGEDNEAAHTAEDASHLFKRKANDAKRATKDLGNKVGNKAEQAGHQAEHAGHKAEHAGHKEGHNLLSSAGDKISAAAHNTTDRAGDALEAAKEKVHELQGDAKERVQHETKKADAKASSPSAVVEQRRMTYGQDDQGKPKGPKKDAGFLGGLRNLLPFGAKGDST